MKYLFSEDYLIEKILFLSLILSLILNLHGARKFPSALGKKKGVFNFNMRLLQFFQIQKSGCLLRSSAWGGGLKIRDLMVKNKELH